MPSYQSRKFSHKAECIVHGPGPMYFFVIFFGKTKETVSFFFDFVKSLTDVPRVLLGGQGRAFRSSLIRHGVGVHYSIRQCIRVIM